MFLGKLWRSIKAQFNKLGNAFASVDPVAQMQLEYDSAVDQLKGLEQRNCNLGIADTSQMRQ